MLNIDISVHHVSSFLGLDPSRYNRSVRENNTEIDENAELFGKDDEERFKHCLRFDLFYWFVNREPLGEFITYFNRRCSKGKISWKSRWRWVKGDIGLFSKVGTRRLSRDDVGDDSMVAWTPKSKVVVLWTKFGSQIEFLSLKYI